MTTTRGCGIWPTVVSTLGGPRSCGEELFSKNKLSFCCGFWKVSVDSIWHFNGLLGETK